MENSNEIKNKIQSKDPAFTDEILDLIAQYCDLKIKETTPTYILEDMIETTLSTCRKSMDKALRTSRVNKEEKYNENTASKESYTGSEINTVTNIETKIGEPSVVTPYIEQGLVIVIL